MTMLGVGHPRRRPIDPPRRRPRSRAFYTHALPLLDVQFQVSSDATITVDAGSEVINGQLWLQPPFDGEAGLSYIGAIASDPIYNETNYPNGVERPYRVVVVDPAFTDTPGGDDSKKYGELSGMSIGTITWRLNDIGTVDFTVDHTRSESAVLQLHREIQIYRGKQIIWWGVITRMRASGDGTMSVQCSDLQWYFTRRNFGKADRNNLLTNGSFEQGVKGWHCHTLSLIKDQPSSPVEALVELQKGITDQGDPERYHAVSFFPKNKDWNSLRISNPDYTDFFHFSTFPFYTERATLEEWYRKGMTQVLHQYATVTGGVNGTKVAFACWYYLPDLVEWDYGYIRPNPMGTGITLSRISTPLFNPANPFPGIIETKSTRIDDKHEKNKWVRHVVELDIPPLVTEIIWARIDPPFGQVHVDAAVLTTDESLENLTVFGDEQVDIFERIVEHAQDSAYDKSDLNIDVVTEDTGVLRYVKHRHTDHDEIFSAMQKYPTLYDGFDFSLDFTPVARWMTTHSPRKGVPMHSVPLELHREIINYTVSYDGEQTANQIIVLGQGDDSSREEGFAVDTSAFDNGLTLEKVYSATPGSMPDVLDMQAARGLNYYKTPVVIPEVTVVDQTGHLFDKLKVGNYHRVIIEHGSVSVDDWYRIVEIALTPGSEEIRLSLNIKEPNVVI